MVPKTSTESLLTFEEDAQVETRLHDMAYDDTSSLQIDANGIVVPVGLDVWRSWTGRRYIFGIEHHGPVYEFGKSETTPWSGSRICFCSTCQTHVAPKLRPN